MSERIDYEAAATMLWHQDRFGNFRDARAEERDEYRRRARPIVDIALPDDDLYTVDELRRAAADLHLSGYLQQVLAEAVKVER